MSHESTHSICINFEIFFNWSYLRICHKGVLSVIRYSKGVASVNARRAVHAFISVNTT